MQWPDGEVEHPLICVTQHPLHILTFRLVNLSFNYVLKLDESMQRLTESTETWLLEFNHWSPLTNPLVHSYPGIHLLSALAIHRLSSLKFNWSTHGQWSIAIGHPPVGKISMTIFLSHLDVIGSFCLSSARTSYHHQYCLSNRMLAPSSLSDQILLPHGHPPPLSGFAHQSIVSPSGRCLHPYSCTSCSCSSCIKGQPPTHPPKQLLFSHCIIFTFSHG